MNSIKCPNCSVVNWSTSDRCLRCTSPLSGVAFPYRGQQPGAASAPSGSDISWRKIAALTVGTAVFGLLLYFVVVPKRAEPKQSASDVQNIQNAPAEQQRIRDENIMMPEQLGVRPFLNTDAATAAAISSIGDGEWTAPLTRKTSRVVASGGT